MFQERVMIIITIYIWMDWVKKSIQLNEKCSMSEKLIDLGEVTSLTWVTVNYLDLKNIVKWREEEYIWETVLSRNKDNWICENLLKINLTSLKFNKNCIHLCLSLVLYTSYMRTMMQIKKFNTQLLRAYLRLIPDFAYLSETFLRHKKVCFEDWNRIKIEWR